MTKKKSALTLAIAILIVLALGSLMLPLQKKLLYTARLTKVDFGGFGEDDHYYFSNGRIESDMTIHDGNVKIGGLYKVAGFYNVYGCGIFTKAYLVSEA